MDFISTTYGKAIFLALMTLSDNEKDRKNNSESRIIQTPLQAVNEENSDEDSESASNNSTSSENGETTTDESASARASRTPFDYSVFKKATTYARFLDDGSLFYRALEYVSFSDTVRGVYNGLTDNGDGSESISIIINDIMSRGDGIGNGNNMREDSAVDNSASHVSSNGIVSNENSPSISQPSSTTTVSGSEEGNTSSTVCFYVLPDKRTLLGRFIRTALSEDSLVVGDNVIVTIGTDDKAFSIRHEYELEAYSSKAVWVEKA